MFRFILTTITLSSLFIVNSTALEPTDTLEPFEGKLRPLGVTPANLLEKRYCDGAPYSNTICCGAYYYCFDYEVCCDSYYCCPSGTTCLGGLLCSPYGNNNPPPAASTTVYTITEKPAVPSTTYVPYYSTYDFTITWYYWYYYYIYDYVIEASTVTSSYVTTHTFIYITATDSVAAQSSFSAVSATIPLSAPYSATYLAQSTNHPIATPNLTSSSTSSSKDNTVSAAVATGSQIGALVTSSGSAAAATALSTAGTVVPAGGVLGVAVVVVGLFSGVLMVLL